LILSYQSCWFSWFWKIEENESNERKTEGRMCYQSFTIYSWKCHQNTCR